jgi:hypothetical protein
LDLDEKSLMKRICKWPDADRVVVEQVREHALQVAPRRGQVSDPNRVPTARESGFNFPATVGHRYSQCHALLPRVGPTPLQRTECRAEAPHDVAGCEAHMGYA